MRAYEVQIKDDNQYYYEGKVEDTFLALVDDMMAAFVLADEYLSRLKLKMVEKNHPDAETIRIYQIREQYSRITEGIGSNRVECMDAWIEKLAEKASKRAKS
jgi:hypothetical protein